MPTNIYFSFNEEDLKNNYPACDIFYMVLHTLSGLNNWTKSKKINLSFNIKHPIFLTGYSMNIHDKNRIQYKADLDKKDIIVLFGLDKSSLEDFKESKIILINKYAKIENIEADNIIQINNSMSEIMISDIISAIGKSLC